MAGTRTGRKKTKGQDLRKLIRQGQKQSMPSTVAPMLCTLTKAPIDDPDYLYELKWDGYRIISHYRTMAIHMQASLAIGVGRESTKACQKMRKFAIILMPTK